MPKHSNHRSSTRDGSVRKYPFRYYSLALSTATSGFTNSNFNLTPGNLGTRLSVAAATFRKWRFTKPLRVKAFLDTTPIAGNYLTAAGVNTPYVQGCAVATAFFGGTTNMLATSPTTMAEMSEFYIAHLGRGQSRITVPLSALREAMLTPWAVTSTAGTLPFSDSITIGSLQAAIFTSPGVNLLAGSWNLWLDIQGEIEFAEPIPEALARQLVAPPVLRSDDEKQSEAESFCDDALALTKSKRYPDFNAESNPNDLASVVAKLRSQGYVINLPK